VFGPVDVGAMMKKKREAKGDAESNLSLEEASP
jgi:hypothetical protein